MRLRTLVVEDEDYQAEAIKCLLEELGENKLKEVGLDGVEVSLANCASEARRLLTQAAKEKKLFDVLLLDLGLPENPGEVARPEVGANLLKFAKEQETVRGVVVVSVFKDLETYARLGADDFVGKPYGEELQARVLKLWQGLKEKWRRQVLKDLAIYANSGVNYRLSSCFSRFIQLVRYETEEIRKELVKELALNPADELPKPMTSHVAAIEEAIKNAREEWKLIQEPFKLAEESPRGVVVEQVLERLAEELRPCLTLRYDSNAAKAIRILSFRDEFQDNVVVVIREILVGSLSEIKGDNFSEFWKVGIEIITTQDGMAKIQFRDNFEPIQGQLAEQINRGDNIAPRDGQWRAWGLSVVQHIASRGGGRLEVQPLEDGNLITYRVTLAQDV